jgi:hypothetical protein
MVKINNQHIAFNMRITDSAVQLLIGILAYSGQYLFPRLFFVHQDFPDSCVEVDSDRHKASEESSERILGKDPQRIAASGIMVSVFLPTDLVLPVRTPRSISGSIARE